MKHIAIVLAAGSGSRMKADVPKQYLELGNKPVLYYSLKQFEESFIDDIILVVREEDIDAVHSDIVQRYGFTKVTQIVSGGCCRSDSVYCGLQAIKEKDAYVYIHDGARPFITLELLKRLRGDVEMYGACIASVEAKDTIKVSDENRFCENTLQRDMLRIIQTPQVFHYEKIMKAYEQIQNENLLRFTDDSMVYEHIGEGKVYLSKGDYFNIKITTPDDMIIGESILQNFLNIF